MCRITRLSACLLAAAIPMSLAGCFSVPLGADPGGSSGSGTTDSGNRAIILDEDNTGYRLGGQCPEVIITADNASVQARRSGSLVLDGEGNSVDVSGSIGSAVDDGDGNSIQAR